MKNEIYDIQITELFKEKYQVPIYQRNYAWGSTQIYQLIDDISDFGGDNYYIGTLVVNKRKDIFEVVDGQQRLTTLFLISKYLGIDVIENLRFEAREKSNIILSHIGDNDYLSGETHELIEGYTHVEDHFRDKKVVSREEKDKFIELMKKVHIIRVQVPENVDLNHYFEVMNTRGEQLELHEIAKSYILKQLEADINAVEAASLVWDACAQMDGYVQMNFDKANRIKLFGSNWEKFDLKDFNQVIKKLSTKGMANNLCDLESLISDVSKLHDFAKGGEETVDQEDVDRKRFESIISFPQFLLHINDILSNDDNEDVANLDDKKLLDNLEKYWKGGEKKAKEFLFAMLKYRFLFDKYIIKRDFKAPYNDDGRWAIQRLVIQRREDKSGKEREGAKYNLTYSVSDDDNEGNRPKDLRMIQSALRITYTSPKTMHWITKLLKSIEKDSTVENAVSVLEGYARNKVDASDYKNKRGFEIQRIVFTYLDYLLYRDGYAKAGIKSRTNDFDFQFRNSIEHFYPQQPADGTKCPDVILNDFGNLALVSTSGNSTLSNYDPLLKKVRNKDIMKQSLKLQIMSGLIKDEESIRKWADDSDLDNNIAIMHGKEMMAIIDKELEQ